MPRDGATVFIQFHNLINSVAKSDSRRSEVYRDILKQDVAHGQNVSKYLDIESIFTAP